MSEFHTLRVSALKKETPTSVSLLFDIPEDLIDTFRFTAGQYVTFKHKTESGEIRRSYSICSSPQSGKLQVAVKKIDGGVFSTYANDVLKQGDSLEVMSPEGKFVVQPSAQTAKNYVAFAAGSGITPVLSIITAVLEEEPQSTFLLVYGNRSLNETMFYNDLIALQSTYGSRCVVEFVYSREEEAETMFGRIDRSMANYFLKNKYKETAFNTYFLCGPEEMIETVSSTLTDSGVPAEEILFELFTSSDEGELTEAHDGNTSITLTVDDETTSFVMPQTQSVLEAALKQGLDTPYSCQGGICSTCIARIVEGKAEMRKNQILTDGEIAEGLVLTCQAHPTTPKLVVDYDDV